MKPLVTYFFFAFIIFQFWSFDVFSNPDSIAIRKNYNAMSCNRKSSYLRNIELQNNEIYINDSYYIRSGLSIMNYLGFTPNDAQKITKVTIEDYISDSLPITSTQFPNLKELVLTKSCFIKNLKGIADFKNLDVFNQEGDYFDKLQRFDYWMDGYCGDSYVDYSNFSEIWKCTTLKKIIINSKVFVNDSIKYLKNLKTFYVNPLIIDPLVFQCNKKLNDLKFGLRNYDIVYLLDVYLLSLKYKMVISSDGNKKRYSGGFDMRYFKRNINYQTIEYKKNKHLLVYYTNGNLALDGWIVNGTPDSIWTYYYKMGDTACVKKYKKGKIFETNSKSSGIYYDMEQRISRTYYKTLFYTYPMKAIITYSNKYFDGTIKTDSLIRKY